MQGTRSLVFMDGPRAGQSVVLREGRSTVGRSHSCTVVVADPLISRRHVQFDVEGETVMVRDLDTSHGTLLNGQRIRGGVSLADGDVLQAGNTRIRYAVAAAPAARPSAAPPATMTLPSIEQPLAQRPADSEASRTKGPPQSDGAETQYAEPAAAAKPAAEPQDQQEATRVLEAQETRMLEKKELRGVSAQAPRASSWRTPLIGFVALALSVGLGALILSAKSRNQDVTRGIQYNYYREPLYGFGLSYPAAWARSADSQFLRFGAKEAGGKLVAWVDILVDRNAAHGLTGLSHGFDRYQDTLRERHAGFRIVGSQAMDVNNARAIFYVFDAEDGAGKGIFLLNGDVRIVVETVCTRDRWNQLAGTFTQVLSSFVFDQPPHWFDFPLPDEQTRRMALSHGDDLKKEARQAMKTGEDLLNRRNVRPENLYRSMEHLKDCLRMCAAFVTPPDFHPSAADLMRKAKQAYQQAVQDQQFAISASVKQGDGRRAYWEAYKLMQMVPDKTDPVYQYAYGITEQYAASSR